ncbi:MAG: hypothetical protein KatS3mg008_1216 [Acidimicrobiales bacterium]|nr:MAG: hypothetical protein KatS3mg008_1216 [Acidimicrobiales bacterium]
MGGRPTRANALDPATWLVLVVGVIASTFAFMVSFRQVEGRQHERLAEAADAVQADIAQLLTDVSSIVSEVSGAVIATDADPENVARLVQPLVIDDPLLQGAAVVTTEAGLQVFSSTGAVDTLERLSENAAALEGLVKTIESIPAGRIGVISRRSQEQVTQVTLAAPLTDRGGASSSFVVMIEISVPRVLLNASGRRVDFAAWLGEDRSDESLLVTTRPPEELRGAMSTTRRVSVGPQTAVMDVAATEPLTSAGERLSPWLLLGGGLALTGIVTPLVQVLARRRQEVATLSEEKRALDEALAVARRIERELRASEQRFRTVLASSPDVILWIDPAGAMLQVLNRNDFFGHPPELVESVDNFLTLVHEEDRPAVRRGLDELRWRQAGSVVTFEFRVVDAEGSWRWIRARGAIASMQEGGQDAPYTVAALTEITAQKEEEAKRAALERQLVQAQRLEAVGQLAGGIAHDFNNILAAILTGTDLLAEEIEGDQAREDLAEIRRTAERGAELARQLLLFARGEVRSNPEVLEPNQVILSVRTMLERAAGDGVELVFDLEEHCGDLYVDRTEIERILMNLVMNARDAMEEGGAVTIRTRRLELDEDAASMHIGVDPGEYVSIEVEDTGCGMPPDVLRRAFEPFFTTKDVGKGTGLGLSTIYGIVQRRKGTVEIESEVGKGTRVRVLLPVTRLTRPAETSERTSGPARHGRLADSAARILVVEDEEAVRENTARLLERNGFDVEVAVDGPDAGRMAATQRFDLVLTDVMLPGGMSGKDVVDVLLRRQPHLAYLFMTGQAGDFLASVGIAEDDPRLIHKPFTEEELVSRVRAVLAQSEQAAL